MKKIALLSATTLAALSMLAQPIAAEAATKGRNPICVNGNRIIFTYGSGCNIKDALDKLENCLPGITLPDVETPGTNVPDINVPGAPENTPGSAPENTPDNLPENAPGNSPENTPGNSPENTPGTEGTHAYVQQVVDLVNAERAKEGLSPLTLDSRVQSAAQVRAMECEQLFSHTRPDGSSFATALKEQNVSYRSAGENIAWGQRSPKEVVNAWMNSSGHRANIMNPNFTTIGVGYYQNANGVNYWCQLFTR